MWYFYLTGKPRNQDIFLKEGNIPYWPRSVDGCSVVRCAAFFIINTCLVAVQMERCISSENLVILNKKARSCFNLSVRDMVKSDVVLFSHYLPIVHSTSYTLGFSKCLFIAPGCILSEWVSLAPSLDLQSCFSKQNKTTMFSVRFILYCRSG